MTHPSHHLNFGMNPDHARNSLSNCGIRQPKYGDRKVHHMHMRKKGVFGFYPHVLACVPCCKLNPHSMTVSYSHSLLLSDPYIRAFTLSIIRMGEIFRKISCSFQVLSVTLVNHTCSHADIKPFEVRLG